MPAEVEDNLIIIVVGFLVIVLLSVGIYTFVLAPEDTTADLYKPVESIDPLKKSLTGVGHKSDLPSESKKLKRLEGTGDDSDEEDVEEDDEYDEKNRRMKIVTLDGAQPQVQVKSRTTSPNPAGRKSRNTSPNPAGGHRSRNNSPTLQAPRSRRGSPRSRQVSPTLQAPRRLGPDLREAVGQPPLGKIRAGPEGRGPGSAQGANSTRPETERF